MSFLAFLVVGRADGAQRSAGAYLAPEAACASASDPTRRPQCRPARSRVSSNWARAQDRRSRLVRRSALEVAAALKGERVAACGQFSHTPCGTAVTSAVQASGYRYAAFGENLFAGTWGHVSARDVVLAWLESPPASREHPATRGSTTSAPPPYAQTACSAAPMRSSGQPPSALAASAACRQESAARAGNEPP